MKSWKNILVPTDLSEEARPALDLALALAAPLSARVHLLHVVNVDSVHRSDADFAPDATAYDHTVAVFEARAGRHVQTDIDRYLDSVGEGRDGVEVGVMVGDIVRCISAYASRVTADVIIVASHVRSGMAHVFLGSIADALVRHAPCPVLIMRRSARTASSVAGDAR